MQKLSQQPTCEKCRAQGRVRAATCVHHIRPCEEARSVDGPDGMRERMFAMSNLMSLCAECHHDIHAAERSHSRQQVEARSQERSARWREAHTLRGESRLPTRRSE